MKKIKNPYIRFIFVIGISLVLSMLISVGVALYLGFRSVKEVKIAVPEDKNVLIVGNSLPQCSLNDTILSDWMNISQKGLYLCDIVPVVDSILLQNRHIDTLIVGVGAVTLTCSDKVYCGRATATVMRFAHNVFMDKKLVLKNLQNPRFIRLLLKNAPDIYLFSEPELYGSFDYLTGHCLQTDLDWRKWLKEYDLADFELDNENFNLQSQAIKDIIDICKRNNVTIILYDAPQYHIYDLWDDKGYYDFLSTLDPETLYADYLNFQFPDTTYYRDLTHTNFMGAKYLSEYIKENGLKTMPLREYLKDPARVSY